MQLAIALDLQRDTPPFAQIVEQIQSYIEGGALAPNAPLPTVRQLARDLGIAPNTVARAYLELQDAGWLVGDGRRGTRVASRVPLQARRSRAHALGEAVSRFVDGMRRRGYTLPEIAAAVGDIRE
ncbi:MAG TPA: GntR family transcriptional regulator [Candidatus Dormibacteraeota bacterium]|nr:GntR family transcriptional regulator [Candidatus Dormibacteraeota bacterium]